MYKKIDLTGQKCGKLTVLKEFGSDKYGNKIWNCLCDCGKELKSTASNLNSGNTSSCGCYQKQRVTKHGHARNYTRTSEYGIWIQIKSRCTNSDDKSYENYGGRGISICNRWSSFDNFLSDMGDRPTNKHSIERINNDGNYEPINCKWATPTEQLRNQRTSRRNTTGVRGVCWDKKTQKYVVRIAIKRKNIWIGSTNSLGEAERMRKEAEIKYWGKSS